jgi:hypothetical protein
MAFLKNKIFLILSLCWLSFNLQAGPVDNFPGVVPLDQSRPAAFDLEKDGEALLPRDAQALVSAGFDLSLLDPVASDLWPVTEEIRQSLLEPLPVGIDGNTVSFTSFTQSRSEVFRFTGRFQSRDGEVNLSFVASKRAHNILLRKALLEKIGYNLPDIQHVRQIKIQFDNPFEKETFLTRLVEDTFGASERWLVSQDEKSLTLQDLVVMPAENQIYNLAMGHVPAEVIRGRRVLNSLLIPYTLAFVPESANLFPWHYGRILSGSLKLDYEAAEGFNPSYDDARWVAKKIAKLTRTDFAEVAAAGKFPSAVEKLILEKLIGRRNSMAKLLKLEVKDLDYNHKISLGQDLKDGKLLKENWPGFASRFSFGDPANPLSASEIFNIFKIKGINTLMTNLLGLFNQFVIPHNNLNEQILDHQIAKLEEALQQALQTGVYRPVPFGFYALPTFGANLIASRDVVPGTYQGADNMVQLADSVGVQVSLGAYIGTDGVAAPWLVSGGANAALTRRYIHLRPIRSVKQALKTPFKNILVPMLKRKIGHLLDGALPENIDNVNPEEENKKYSELMKFLSEELPVGDSLMITDSLGLSEEMNVGYGFTQMVAAQAKLFGNQLFLSRLHILRKDAKTIHIYKDLGNINGVGLSFGVNAFIPILKVAIRLEEGKARTKFYKLDINDDREQNPNLQRNLLGLRTLLLKNEIEVVESFQKPIVVKHDFTIKTGEFGFLLWRWANRKFDDLIEVTHPSRSEPVYFIRHGKGRRFGRNYQALATDLVNGLINSFSPVPLGISNEGNGNPADTLFGSAESKESIYEAQVESFNKKKKEGEIKKHFLAISYKWRGQSASDKKLAKILKKVSAKFPTPVYPQHAFDQTESLKFYAVTLDFYYYHRAFEAILKKNERELLNAFNRYSTARDINFYSHIPGDAFTRGGMRETYSRADQISDHVSRVERYLKKIKKYTEKKKYDKVANYNNKLFYFLDDHLPIAGIAKLVGGENNFFANSSVRGFRIGDEAGDSPFISDSLGSFGDPLFVGPVNSVKSITEMTEAEFYATWIMGVF